VVTLTSSNSAVATVPASVTVAASSSSATFSINTTGVSSTTAVTITASYGNASAIASLTVQAGSSSGTWYNSAWGYRNAITVTNGSGGALTNFQINVKLSSGFPFSSANANGSDVLFTASDGVTLIPFWLETWNPGLSTASLWVNVPSIPTAGTTIYLYYGNPSASSLSSGTATFNFFDDFSESTVDTTRWTAYGGTWTIVTDTRQDRTTGGVLSGTTTARQVLESSYTGTNYVLQVYGKQMSGRVWGVGTRGNTSNNLYSANLYDDLDSTNNLYLYRWLQYSAVALGDAAVGTVSANTWYQLMVKVYGNNIDVYKDGVLEVQGTDSSLATGGVALYGESGTVAEFNNVFVRQYATVEPTLSIGGSVTQGTGAVSSLAVSPTTVLGGVSSQGTVTLSAAAPTGGAVVTLTSSNTAVATVPASISVPAGSTTGTFSVTTTSVSSATSVTITGTYAGSSRVASLTVQYLKSIAVTPSNLSLNTGSSQQYTATGTLGGGTTSNLSALVTWSTSSSSIATISASGLLMASNVGTATVTATYGSISGSTRVTVGQFVLQSIALSPSTSSIGVGGTQAFIATGTYGDGSTQNLTSTATWSSSNTAVATVTSSGVATGVVPGTVTITATSGSVSGTATLSLIPAVFTYHYDVARSGVNSYETTLTTSNVNSRTFGKKFSLPADGAVYAQPLYVPNVAIPGKGTHNVLYVATANDSLFAFDADSNTGNNSTPLWQVSVIDTAHGAAPGATAVSSSVLACMDINPIYGITSTPVIDLSTGTIYLVANSVETASGNIIYRLHALDITSGAEKSGSPVVITASVTGTGDGSVGSILTFQPKQQLNRAALLLASGNVYIGFGSHCDASPWHGWLLSYNAASLVQNGVFVTTPNGGMGGIWMSGSGVAADANGNLYLATGNGTFDSTNVPATELGDSIIKLNANLALLDYFTPYDQLNMSNGDRDLGSGGVLLLGNQGGNYPNLLLQSGKTGTLYLINRDQMTTGNSHYCSISCGNTDPQIVQEVQYANNGMWSSLAYWNNNVYLWGAGEGTSVDYLKAYSLTNGVLSTAPTSKSAIAIGFPGATPVISSNGTANGIVWVIDSSNNGTDGSIMGAAVLHAYDATNLSHEFYNSTQAAGNRDQAGDAVKFTVPVVINGKVYVGTSSEVDVYGLLP
jgi:hypothetical protein